MNGHRKSAASDMATTDYACMRVASPLLDVVSAFFTMTKCPPPPRGSLSFISSSGRLDLPRLVHVQDEVHEPPNLLDKLADVLQNQRMSITHLAIKLNCHLTILSSTVWA